MTNSELLKLAYKKHFKASKLTPKKNNEVWVRHSNCNAWEIAKFISKTDEGFKVYKACLCEDEYIDTFPMLTTCSPYEGKVFIFEA